MNSNARTTVLLYCLLDNALTIACFTGYNYSNSFAHLLKLIQLQGHSFYESPMEFLILSLARSLIAVLALVYYESRSRDDETREKKDPLVLVTCVAIANFQFSTIKLLLLTESETSHIGNPCILAAIIEKFLRSIRQHPVERSQLTSTLLHLRLAIYPLSRVDPTRQ